MVQFWGMYHLLPYRARGATVTVLLRPCTEFGYKQRELAQEQFATTLMQLLLGAVILFPAHPASFAHDFVFLFQRVREADSALKIVFWKFAVGTH